MREILWTAPPGYGKCRVDVDWLKVGAVLAAQGDRLDEWSCDLPARLGRMVRQAQDAPAGRRDADFLRCRGYRLRREISSDSAM